jgi:signal transduction histidine kinase
VAVVTSDGQTVLASGKTSLPEMASPAVPSESWGQNGFRLVEAFELAPAPFDEAGSGPGRGRGMRWRAEEPDAGEPFAGGGQFAAILLLDRSRADALRRSAAWSDASVAAAGGLVLVCVALAWRASVRLVEARGRARVLEAETRHLRDLGQAAAGLAHETRNPLGLIRGWTQRLAQSDTDDPERQEHAQALIEECDRVTARINEFLAFARPCAPSPQTVDLGQLVDELAAVLQPDLEAKNLRLEREQPLRDPRVLADRELLRQALFNLMQNAIHFAPEGDAVRIAILPGHDGQARIEVADRGPGVADTSVGLLFTPYFTTRPGGTGLGLAIVRRIAAAHGWRADYRPRNGGGSVFFLDGLHG